MQTEFSKLAILTANILKQIKIQITQFEEVLNFKMDEYFGGDSYA